MITGLVSIASTPAARKPSRPRQGRARHMLTHVPTLSETHTHTHHSFRTRTVYTPSVHMLTPAKGSSSQSHVHTQPHCGNDRPDSKEREDRDRDAAD
jgi:hypothetical protein